MSCSDLTSHLVCAFPGGHKHAAAIAYNATTTTTTADITTTPSTLDPLAKPPNRRVHIVSEDWLWQSLRRWERQEEALYAVPEGATQKEEEEEGDMNVEIQCEMDMAVEDEDEAIGDISPLRSLHTSSSISQDHTHNQAAVVSFHSPSKPERVTKISVVRGSADDSSALPRFPLKSVPSHSLSPPPCSVQTQTDTETQTQTQTHEQKQNQKYFMFGTASDKKISKSRAILESLGGVVLPSEGHGYDMQCTHLLLWRFERTEKCMCACAAGKVSRSVGGGVCFMLCYSLSTHAFPAAAAAAHGADAADVAAVLI